MNPYVEATYVGVTGEPTKKRLPRIELVGSLHKRWFFVVEGLKRLWDVRSTVWCCMGPDLRVWALLSRWFIVDSGVLLASVRIPLASPESHSIVTIRPLIEVHWVF